MVKFNCLIFALFLITGCSNAEKDWTETLAKDNKEAYEAFLKKHGDSKFANLAKEKILGKISTEDEFVKFIKEFKSGKEVDTAKQRLNKIYFDKALDFYKKDCESKDAEQLLLKIVEIDPKHEGAYFYLALIYHVSLTKRGMAVGALEKVIAINPKNSIAYSFLGWLIYSDGIQMGHDPEPKAFEYHKKAIGLDPKNDWSYEELGYILFGRGEVSEAIKLFNKAIELNPERSKSHYYLAIIYYKQNRLKDCIDHYDKSQKLGYKPGGFQQDELGEALKSRRKK